jgi:hypothetical protein
MGGGLENRLAFVCGNFTAYQFTDFAHFVAFGFGVAISIEHHPFTNHHYIMRDLAIFNQAVCNIVFATRNGKFDFPQLFFCLFS